MLVLSCGNEDFVKYLVENGADINENNSKG